MTYTVPEDAVAAERLRHRHLAEILDNYTRRIFEKVGVDKGWDCLEVGMGGGSVAAMLADMVGESGSVLATDIDLRLSEEYLAEPPPQVEIRKHDIASDPLPDHHFDLAHARATLEHVTDPDAVLKRLAGCVKPGGWVVIEGGDFSIFDLQPFPPEYGKLMAEVRKMTRRGDNDHQDRFYVRAIPAMRDAGLVDVDFEGQLFPMKGGQPSAEWFSLALEWGVAGMVDAGLLERAIAESREDNFLIISPCHFSLWGKVPAA